MIGVATGGPRIQEKNDEFRESYGVVAAELRRRGIENPLPYADLWDWYGRWSSGDMPTYQSRRVFVNEVCNPLIQTVRSGAQPSSFAETGWPRVDRCVGELRSRLSDARTEEQFQAVGLIAREALISLAQAVFDPVTHAPIDGVSPSETDAARMLMGYMRVEFPGTRNEESRRHAKSALNLAVSLQHRRTATFRDAALCVEATTTVINIVAILSGRRDPD
jgi:hypothetical protein